MSETCNISWWWNYPYVGLCPEGRPAACSTQMGRCPVLGSPPRNHPLGDIISGNNRPGDDFLHDKIAGRHFQRDKISHRRRNNAPHEKIAPLWKSLKSSKVRHFSTFLHILAWVRPCDNRGKCYMDGKRIQCWSNAWQHIPIYLQPFTS